MKVLLLVLLTITSIYAGDNQWVFCAKEHKTCKCDTYISWGAGRSWYSTWAFTSQPCNNRTFRRDPAPGKTKTCWCLKPKPIVYGKFKKVKCARGGYVEGTL